MAPFLGIGVAVLGVMLCVVWGFRARHAVTELGRATEAGSRALPPEERSLERREALGLMKNQLLETRGAARVSLAVGTGTSVFALASGLSDDLTRALTASAVCFAAGALGSAIVAHLGRSASHEFVRFRDQWNQR